MISRESESQLLSTPWVILEQKKKAIFSRKTKTLWDLN